MVPEQKMLVKLHWVATSMLYVVALLRNSVEALNVNLVFSPAPLLSGGLTDCPTPEAETCIGGVATVSAYVRNYVNSTGEAVFSMHRIDRISPFVQMHPMGWNVNFEVLHRRFGNRVAYAAASLLTSKRDLSILGSKEMSILVSNVLVPPSNPWYGFTDIVHFDSETNLAVIYVQSEAQPNSWPALDSAKNALDRIAAVNENTVDKWVPVILHDFTSHEVFRPFLSAIKDHSNPPHFILKIGSIDDEFEMPKSVNDKTWVASCGNKGSKSYRLHISLGPENAVQNVTLHVDDLKKLPAEMKDSVYIDDQNYLRKLAIEATEFDPVVGTSGSMPLTRTGNIRRCFAGECIIGNLFTDAMRWKEGADIAFTPSGGLRGPGWPAGQVRMSDLWSALPFANNLCSGVLSGLSIFKILDYSASVATFTSTYSEMGDRLMQVSGLRYTYNTELNGPRIISIDVWDKGVENFVPLQRLKLYSVVSDNFLCGIFDPFPEFFKSEAIEGEVPSRVTTEYPIQNVVGEYLTQLNEPYNTEVQGRLLNDTSALLPLRFVQAQDMCSYSDFWDVAIQACAPCPIAAAKENLVLSEAEGTAETGQNTTTRFILSNRDIFDVNITVKSTPNWAQLVNGTAPEILNGKKHVLRAGESIAFDMLMKADDLDRGVAQGPVLFTVMEAFARNSDCKAAREEIGVDVRLHVTPPPQRNYLSRSLRTTGLVMMAIVMLTSFSFAIWVHLNRKVRVVKYSQPMFLHMICSGIFIMSTSIVPLSIDDRFISVQGCNIACMAMPWLLSMGFILTFSALLSKLRKINTVVDASLRLQRIKLSLLDIFKPLIIIFLVNGLLLLIWTVTDPIKWERSSSKDTDGFWNTHGSCTTGRSTGYVFFILIILFDILSLFLTCVHAYKARNIVDDLSESKYIGIAACCWLEVFIIAIPTLIIVKENSNVAFFLWLAIIFVLCMSMLLLIFVPKILIKRLGATRQLSGADIFRKGKAPKNYITTSSRSQVTTTSARKEVHDEESPVTN